MKPDVSCEEKVNSSRLTKKPKKPLNMLTDSLRMVFQSQCDEIFDSAPFRSCGNRLDMESFRQVCTKDTCAAGNSTNAFLCKTISEFSRQCVYAGGKPQKWRNETFCRESSFQSAPETEDLSRERHSHGWCPQITSVPTTWSTPNAAARARTRARTHLPARHVTSNATMAAAALKVVTRSKTRSASARRITGGKTCVWSSSGTVFDDIAKAGCVAQNQCPCVHNNIIYGSGESYSHSCGIW